MVEVFTDSGNVQGSVMGQMTAMGHEQVAFCVDEQTGLKSIIAVHNTNLGPSLGGVRMWPYANEQEALKDALRLSRGMTYKSALAGLKLGGGKSVIIGDSRTQKTEALMRRFGRFVETQNGKYIAAEDVGMSPSDMQAIRKETKHVVGLPESDGGAGDPSPFTAYGVYMGMKAAAMKTTGEDSLEGFRVLVQGVGHVGAYLVGHLVREGAHVMVTDIHEQSLQKLAKQYPVEVVAPDAIYDLPMDVYAPCALGATLNDATLDKLRCSIVAGAANNQLADETIHGQRLMEKGILYVPDFLGNAGGIINCYYDLVGYDAKKVEHKVEEIYSTAMKVFEKAELENIPTYLAANRLAEERFMK